MFAKAAAFISAALICLGYAFWRSWAYLPTKRCVDFSNPPYRSCWWEAIPMPHDIKVEVVLMTVLGITLVTIMVILLQREQ